MNACPWAKSSTGKPPEKIKSSKKKKKKKNPERKRI
jgi:hypothetical protein